MRAFKYLITNNNIFCIEKIINRTQYYFSQWNKKSDWFIGIDFKIFFQHAGFWTSTSLRIQLQFVLDHLRKKIWGEPKVTFIIQVNCIKTASICKGRRCQRDCDAVWSHVKRSDTCSPSAPASNIINDLFLLLWGKKIISINILNKQ